VSQVPVLIACRDRLTPLVGLVEWLERAGCQRIVLVDNDSAFEPLLQYYKDTPHTVIKLGRNIGPQSFWAAGVVEEHAGNSRYVVTDPDLLPTSDCPSDALERFDELLDRYPERQKAGFGLKIDDLPAWYKHTNMVRLWEQQFWRRELEPGVFDADIDTTFALYRAEVASFGYGPALRTGAPYMARHTPWYSDSSRPTAEDRFYHQRYLRERQAEPGIRTTWNDRRVPRHVAVDLGLKRARSDKPWARGVRFIRNGFRRTGYSGL